MAAGSGKLLKSDDSVFDLTALLDSINTALAGTGLKISGGGGVGGGNNIWSNPQDFTAAYASATTLTLTSIPFVPTNAQFVSVKVQPASGVAVTYTPDSNAFSYNASTGVLTVAGAAFVNTDTYVVTLLGPKKAPFDSATASDKASLIRDVSDQYVAETLIDSTNVAAATNYYPSASGVSMDGFSSISIQGMTSGGVTTTIEATNDDAASPDWVDITKSFIDMITAVAGGASFVDVNFLLSLANKDVLNVKAIRIKSVTSDATNAVQYNIRRIY